jgi:hypothetical protein
MYSQADFFRLALDFSRGVAFKVAFKEFLGKPRNSRAFVKEF